MLPARAAGARRSAYVLRALACSTSVMLSTGCSPSRSLSLSWTPVVSRRRRERLEGVSPSPRPAGYDTVYKRFAQGLGSPPPTRFCRFMAATCRFAADALFWRGRSSLPGYRTLRRGGSRNTLPCARTLRGGGVGGICTLRQWISRKGHVATVSLALAENLCKEALCAQVVLPSGGRLLD